MTQQGTTSAARGSQAVLLGRYRLIKELGRGGFAVVWEAEDIRDGSRVAVKALEPDGVLDPQVLSEMNARFKLEIEAVSRISHPNVVAIHDAGTINNTARGVVAYYAMELINGHTLDVLVQNHGPLEPKQAASIIRQAAKGLHAAHQVAVVHRDIKPQNLMLAEDARVVIMDFGICKLRGTDGITRIGTVVGTLRYLSPEQMKGETVGVASDIYSLGLVLYYLLTGKHLRHQEDFVSMYLAVRKGFDADLATRSEIPDPLKRILQRALLVKPECRYPTALELAKDLEAAYLEMSRSGARRLPAPPQSDEEELNLTTNTLRILVESMVDVEPGCPLDASANSNSFAQLFDEMFATCPTCHRVFATSQELAAHRDAAHSPRRATPSRRG